MDWFTGKLAVVTGGGSGMGRELVRQLTAKVSDSRQEWERTFAIDWWGVYYCARVFLPATAHRDYAELFSGLGSGHVGDESDERFR